jgi:hypothetical protein
LLRNFDTFFMRVGFCIMYILVCVTEQLFWCIVWCLTVYRDCSCVTVVWVSYVCPVRIVCVSDDVIVVCSVKRVLYCIFCDLFRCFVLWFVRF